ncbi:MAG: 30S ribosomal protein S20 [Planctomycetia bacterium]|nr:30S ribosomal protein S20 [Planctomycetia bacterium]
MPNIASARKRNRQNIKARARNRAAKSAVRTQIRRLDAAMAAGDNAVITAEFRATVKRLDQTAAKGIIHRNVASRTKSRLSARVKAVQTGTVKKVETAKK